MAFNEALDKEYKEAVNKHKQAKTFSKECRYDIKGTIYRKEGRV
jgi:hypothetical protein